MWLAWTPQLLMSLQRQEGPHARRLLLNIAQLFPQTIYYALRTMMLGLRDMAVKVVKVSFPLLSSLPVGWRELHLVACACAHTMISAVSSTSGALPVMQHGLPRYWLCPLDTCPRHLAAWPAS